MRQAYPPQQIFGLPPGLPGVRQAYPPYQIFGLPPGLPGARLPSDMYGLGQEGPVEQAVKMMPLDPEMKAAATGGPAGDLAAAILVFVVSGTLGAFVANLIGFMGAGLGTAVAPINVRMRK